MDSDSESPDVDVRLATFDDIPVLNEIINKAYRSSSGWTNESKLISGARTTESQLKEIVTKLNDTNILLCIVDNKDDQVVGSVLLEWEPFDGTKPVVHLGMFSIKPELQNKNYGKMSLWCIDLFLREKLGREFEIEIAVLRQREELIEFYENRNFKKTGKMISYPYQNKEIGFALRDDLEFVILKKTVTWSDVRL